MLNFREDQAAGLRRIMTSYQPKIITILSADTAESQSRLVGNLAATMRANNIDILVVQARQDYRTASRLYGMDNAPSLYEVAYERSALAQSVKSAKLGFSVAKLLPKNRQYLSSEAHADMLLNKVFTSLSELFEVVLVEAKLTEDYLLPLEILNDHEVLIRMNRDSESIKQAYVLIKQICSQIGRRSFGIVVEGASDAQAATVFRNISQVASEFLQVELEFIGAIPGDAHLERAAKLGRSITDAFPLSQAAKAYQSLAQRLNYQQVFSDAKELASFA